MNIAFTGARKIAERTFIWHSLLDVPDRGCRWHVGDAAGVDAVVREFAAAMSVQLTVHRVEVRQRWGFAERSQRMIDVLSVGDRLIAFPNKPCPDGCNPQHPFSGHGSGTWGTIAYARKKGIQIEILWLGAEHPLPQWLAVKQLELF